jgi:hypothetical protein
MEFYSIETLKIQNEKRTIRRLTHIMSCQFVRRWQGHTANEQAAVWNNHGHLTLINDVWQA